MAISPVSASAWAYPAAGSPGYDTAVRNRAGGSAAPGQDRAAQDPARASAPGGTNQTMGGGQLSEAELRQVQQLQQRDREVRAHEMAHVAAGAGLVTRGASYTYQTGPDGQRYAIGGEVSIDTSPGRTPEETLAKAEQIRSAALAPADPSPQDRQVAAQATRMAMDARMEIARQAFERGNGSAAPDSESGAAPRQMPGEPGADAVSGYLGRQARSAYEAAAQSMNATPRPGLNLTA